MTRGCTVSLILCILIQCALPAFAQENTPISGLVIADDINVRSDSTIGSKIICSLKRGDTVEVISQFYEWYKIRLPKQAPVFIKRSLVDLVDEKTARVTKQGVNIRIAPAESSVIIGKADRDEVFKVFETKNGWCKIEPSDRCFGWIHKKFIKQLTAPLPPKNNTPQIPSPEAPLSKSETIATLQGTIGPYGKSTGGEILYKLTADKNADFSALAKKYGLRNKIFILKGTIPNINFLNYRKVKISGKLVPESTTEKYPVIEIKKLEATQ